MREDKNNFCLACGHDDFAILPHLTRGMMSNGRILEQPLAKKTCKACGLTCHQTPLSADDIRGLYEGDYDLPDKAAEDDHARATAYAAFIRDILPGGFRPNVVIDIGSGSGAMIHNLAETYGTKHAIGIDPAGPETSENDVRLLRGNAEDLVPQQQRADLIVSVNTLEHVADPLDILRLIKRQITPDGRIVIVVPATSPANMEVMFFDHISGFSPAALGLLANAAGLMLEASTTLPQSFGDFQSVVLRLAKGASKGDQGNGFDKQMPDYITAWASLDARLSEQIKGESVLIFGAGQMAALLRCYCPKVWSKLDHLILDKPELAWNLGPVSSVPEWFEHETEVVIATHPRHHSAIAKRITSLGGTPITFDDLICR